MACARLDQPSGVADKSVVVSSGTYESGAEINANQIPITDPSDAVPSEFSLDLSSGTQSLTSFLFGEGDVFLG